MTFSKYIFIFTLFCIQNLICKSNPDFLIIGAMKCGTSSLYHYLTQHPQIKRAAEKEIGFFSINFTKGQDWYESQFPNKNEGEVTGEATPEYMLCPDAPERVFNLYPKMKLIILLRNPVKRAISHFYHVLQRKFYGKIKNLHFEEALKEEYYRLDSNLGDMVKKQSHPLKFTCLSRGLYLEQILRWTKFFPKKQILFIISEDELYENPKTTLNKVFEFLELPEKTLTSYPIINKNNIKKNVNQSTLNWLYNYYDIPNKKLEKYLGRELPWKKNLSL